MPHPAGLAAPRFTGLLERLAAGETVTPELIAQAVAAGADYVAFGAFFPSGTKPGARRASPGLLRDSAALGCTRVAIGGITPDNAAGLVAAGADLRAVIGGVFDAPDPVAALRAFRRAFEPNTHETAHQ